MSLIDTTEFSANLRQHSIDLEHNRLLITNFHGTSQEQDLTEPPNCGGFGRVRHFRRNSGHNWPPNPLPIEPACKALGLPPTNMIRAQVFQNAACNWRCWYCFVPFRLLSANPKYSAWMSAAELVELYLAEEERPLIIDLTGGQPDLVPEWIPWMMAALKDRGLEESIYLWSDDNLSNDYFWRYLSEAQREFVATYPMYGRVCCFKGFDEASFTFNTRAEPELWQQQFELMSRFLTLGIDLYAYVTLTSLDCHNIQASMKRFVDKLQGLHPNFPLRTVPLKIDVFTPVQERATPGMSKALTNQYAAVEAWLRELEDRYSYEERNQRITDILLSQR